MSYFCDICSKTIKHKSKYKHFKSSTHKEFDKYNHIKITIKKPNLNKIDIIFYDYIIEYNKKFEYYLVKCEFKLIFNNLNYSPHVTSRLFDNKTMISLRIFLKDIINDFNNQGYSFNHISELNIITKVRKLFMTYDFYITRPMPMFERKINMIISRNPHLINAMDRNHNHPLIRRYADIPFNN